MNAPRQESMIKYLLISSIFFFLAFFKIQILHFKRRYSVFQAHNMPDHLIFIGIIQKIFGTKLILDIHDLTLELFEEKWPGKKNLFLKSVVKLIEKISCKIADEVLTVTKTCKERLISRGVPDKKITLVINTPNTEIFKYNSNKKYETINKNAKLIYHGTIAFRFGLHIAIEAMHIILEKIPLSTLNIYGQYDPHYKISLQERIKFLKLEDYVILNGIVDREQLPDLLYNSDIGIVPYLSNEYMNLALPTKAFEYIATGLPVVSTKLEDLSKTFSSESISYIDQHNPLQFAEKVIELCTDPIRRKNQADRAIEEMRLISGEVMSERYVLLLNKLSNI
jgi:glycosyltransferase involved in cell wall biosynthesis